VSVVDEEQASTAQQVKDRIPRDRPLGVIHSGGRYLIGFGPDFYGIWDAATEGSAVEQFPATRQGRVEAWNQYVSLEPAAQKIPAEQSPMRGYLDQVREVEGPSRRRAIFVVGAIALALIIAIVAVVASRSTKSGPSAKAGGTTGGQAKAHVDITGTSTLSEDLKLKSFTSPARVLSGVVRASWAGAKTTVTLAFENISAGEFPTTQFPQREVDISFTAADGSKVEVTSVAGECTIKIDKESSTSVSGSFNCSGVKPADTSQTVDIKGTFSAQS
jgi:hypothetical protein